MKQEIVSINPQEFGLEKKEAEQIESVFIPMIEKMKEMESEYNQIVALPITAELTQKARELRLRYVKVRTGTKEIHKTAKAYYLAGGRFVDAWKNAQEFSAMGKESELEKIEKHFELIEQAKKDKINAERERELSKYTADVSMFNYKDIPDETFAVLVASVKSAYEKEQAAIKQAETDRLKKEEEERAEQERIRKENERLKAEAEAREAEIAKERAEQQAKIDAEKAKAKAEAEAREKAEAELKASQLEKERIENEKQAQEQAEKLAKLEAEKLAELAPDKEKLKKYAVDLGCLEVPKLQSEEGKETLKKALSLLNQAITLLKV